MCHFGQTNAKKCVFSLPPSSDSHIHLRFGQNQCYTQEPMFVCAYESFDYLAIICPKRQILVYVFNFK